MGLWFTLIHLTYDIRFGFKFLFCIWIFNCYSTILITRLYQPLSTKLSLHFCRKLIVYMWSEIYSVVSDSLRPHGRYSTWNSPGQNTGMGSFSLLQGIFPIQRLNPGLPHCRQILHQLSHKESPRILEWVAYPFSSRSSWTRSRTRVSCIADGFFTNWAMMEAVKVYFWTFSFIPLKFCLLLCKWNTILTI